MKGRLLRFYFPTMRECGGAWCDDDDDASITTSTAERITEGKNMLKELRIVETTGTHVGYKR